VTQRVSWAEASARRLARNGLAAPLPDAGPADAVATMCGAHAQVLSLVDGTVAGVWHQRRSGRKIAVTVEPFRTLSKARRDQLDEQVTRVRGDP
jgi:hypothetical protein